ncbi:hypothetical protein V5O48_018670, partial [Marasmius crinis-equi]
LSPNHTAWCDTVTEFLDQQGYRIAGKDSLRRRFSNALQWYSALQHATKESRSLDNGEDDSLLGSPPLTRPSSAMSGYDYPPDSSPTSSRPTSPLVDESDEPGESLRGDDNRGTPESDDNHPTGKRARFAGPKPKLTRPSEYLQLRCPYCYGGSYGDRDPELGFDVIVCLDACFTQKHNKTRGRDPLKKHPDSVFVSEEELRGAEEYVEELRPSRSKPGNEVEEEGEDGYEGNMSVPRSALNGCHESFTVADERRQKASTQFFDCTGLMVLLCCHDRVLWLANMTSAGEKQFYVIPLLRKLFEHLPDDYLIGLLYDIGCQLDRSCDKWGFLEEFQDRLAFAISVFHAFGHHWACQLVYHPRKRKGFGLSDGEGCERFWHSISRLIPYLRVCGYHQRLYTLDCQVEHADEANLQGLAGWWSKKLSNAQATEIHGRREMTDSGKSDTFLMEQWECQIQEQTKPLPRKSNTLGKKAVEEVMRLRTTVEMLEKKVRDLENVVTDLDADDLDHAQAIEDLPKAHRKLGDAQKRGKAKERLLSVEETQTVRHLVSSPFLRDRMKALVLKTRLMTQLRARKFQRDRLECSFRKQTNEAKLNVQIEQSVKRQEPGIQRLAREYNALAKKRQGMVRKRPQQCPRNAVAPVPIPMDNLFSLDVDDEIWQDVGLTDEWDRDELPPWLANDQVRAGIRGLLSYERAREEIWRLTQERDAMQQWFAEEWSVILHAIERTVHPDVKYLDRQAICIEEGTQWEREVEEEIPGLRCSGQAPSHTTNIWLGPLALRGMYRGP